MTGSSLEDLEDGRSRLRKNGDREPQHGFPSRLDVIIVIGLLFVAVLSWLPRSQGEIDLRVDAGVYYLLGTSLADGHGYRLSNEPGNIRANQYPPLVPSIIALEQKLDRTTDPALIRRHLKLLWLFLLLVFTGLAYCVLRSSFSAGWSCLAVVFCLLNTQLCFYSNQSSAEFPFAVLSLLFVVLYRRGSKGEALTSAVAVAAFFCRTIGIALLGAWIVDAILRKQLRRAALRSAVAMACVLTWAFYVHSVETSLEYKRPAYAYQRAPYLFYNVSYAKNVAYKDPFRPELGFATFGDRIERFFANVAAVPSSAGEAATSYADLLTAGADWLNKKLRFSPFPPAVVPAIVFVLGCCILAGIGVLVWRREWFLGLYILFTIVIACCPPWQQISRYLVPIAALLFFSLFTLFEWLRGITFTRFSKRGVLLLRGLVYVAVVAAVCGQAAGYLIAVRYSQFQSYAEGDGKVVRFRQFLYRPQDVELDDAAMWIRHHANPSDIVAAAMPQWVYVNTGHQTVMPPFEVEADKEESLLESVSVRYLIVETKSKLGDSARDYVLRMVRKFAARWPEVYVSRDGNVRVFENVGVGK